MPLLVGALQLSGDVRDTHHRVTVDELAVTPTPDGVGSRAAVTVESTCTLPERTHLERNA